MRIFAVSDWRVQSLDLLSRIVERERPDVILYAGDDLRRVCCVKDEILLQVGDIFLRFSYPDYELQSTLPGVIIDKNNLLRLKSHLKYTIEQGYLRGDFQKLKFLRSIPFYAVGGNDDRLTTYDKNEYV